MMPELFKRIIAWVFVTIGVIGVALSYTAIGVLLAYFASGVGWQTELIILVSGPIAGIGALVARRNQRQNLAMFIGSIAFCLWIILWLFLFAVYKASGGR